MGRMSSGSVWTRTITSRSAPVIGRTTRRAVWRAAGVEGCVDPPARSVTEARPLPRPEVRARVLPHRAPITVSAGGETASWHPTLERVTLVLTTQFEPGPLGRTRVASPRGAAHNGGSASHRGLGLGCEHVAE